MEQKRIDRIESVVDNIPLQLTELLVAQAKTDGKLDSLADKYDTLATDVKAVFKVAGENKLSIVKILAWTGVGSMGGGGLIALLLKMIENI